MLDFFIVAGCVTFPFAYWHFCVYVAKWKDLSLKQTNYLYGVPFVVGMYFVAKAATFYDSIFLDIFMTFILSLAPLNVAFGFFESEKRMRTSNFTGHIK